MAQELGTFLGIRVDSSEIYFFVGFALFLMFIRDRLSLFNYD
jgi:hypothetical protein